MSAEIRDRQGYVYEYDYENRIVKIKEGNNDRAEFAYDALGRRIRKIDSVASETTLYYYDQNWRVLAEYDGSNNIRRKFAYGNTIDEVLFMIDSDSTEYYYTHDHLHSPAVLLTLGGTIHERYEYDAYGNPTIYTGDGGDGNWFDGDETSGDSSALGNPYLFTGRRVDFLDSNDLVLQYNRNRYYDYYTGRWLTQDPLGYIDGMSLYEGCLSNPVRYVDPLGLKGIFGGIYIHSPSGIPIPMPLIAAFGPCCPDCIPRSRDYRIVRAELYPSLTPPERMKKLRKSLAVLDVITFFRFERPYFDPTWPVAHSITSIYVKAILGAAGETTGYDMYIIVREKRCEKAKRCRLFRKTWTWVHQKEYAYKCEVGPSYEKDVGHGCHQFVDKEELHESVNSCIKEFHNDFDHNTTATDRFLWAFGRCINE